MGGCVSKKPADDVVKTVSPGETSSGQEKPLAKSHTDKTKASTRGSLADRSDEEYQIFRRELFMKHGNKRPLVKGEAIIKQGQMPDAMYWILSGSCSLMKMEKPEDAVGKEIGKRGPGDMMGEMSYLAGELPAVSVSGAEDNAVVYALSHSDIEGKLLQDAEFASMFFKMIATYLGERISELSSKMRSEVIARSDNQGKTAQTQSLPLSKVAKFRQIFNIPSDEPLMLTTTCSMRKEDNGVKETHMQFGDLVAFQDHLCFNFRVFGFHKQQVINTVDVLSVLKSQEAQTLELQCKGSSYEIKIDTNFEDSYNILEACRRTAFQGRLKTDGADISVGSMTFEPIQELPADFFREKDANSRKQSMVQPNGLAAVSFELSEADWGKFLSGAKQLKFRRGDFVLREGTETAALYQIITGSIRVELKLKEQTQAVVVGQRGPGDMFGDTSLLKGGTATASIVADDEEVVLMVLEGEFLAQLFVTDMNLCSRFYAFLAKYLSRRLHHLTTNVTKEPPQATASANFALDLMEILTNKAFVGIFKKYLEKQLTDDKDNAEKLEDEQTLNFWLSIDDYKQLPTLEELQERGKDISHNLVPSAGLVDTSMLATATVAKEIRHIFDPAQEKAFERLQAPCNNFRGSTYYHYILEMKAKQGLLPNIHDFKLIKILGQGGFGQVLEAVKRDCGKTYAIKIMGKAVLREDLGLSWKKLIRLERDLSVQLRHRFLVNLKYTYQNADYLFLVMDLVRGGDLSEFVLTNARINPEQVRFVAAEVVCILSYMHRQKVMYRDLKPENLLVDEEGHIRLIDMGLAGRFTDAHPRRKSRVGTYLYMAPEVRFIKDRPEFRGGYTKSCDWYTLGVLIYELLTQLAPFMNPDQPNPIMRKGYKWPSDETHSIVEGLLRFKPEQRLGCMPRGEADIREHPYFSWVEWEIAENGRMPSPLLTLNRGRLVNKPKNIKNMAATAENVSNAEAKDDESTNVSKWEFVSEAAIEEEYLSNIYQAVSNL